MEMLVPWNDVFAVVAVGLWSMLSTSEVVNSFFLKTGGQTTPLPPYPWLGSPTLAHPVNSGAAA